MKQLALFVDTLRCEVDDALLVEEVMAVDGVIAVDVDLVKETIRLAYDDGKTSRDELMQFLGFFGLRPSAHPVAPALAATALAARTRA